MLKDNGKGSKYFYYRSMCIFLFLSLCLYFALNGSTDHQYFFSIWRLVALFKSALEEQKVQKKDNNNFFIAPDVDEFRHLDYCLYAVYKSFLSFINFFYLFSFQKKNHCLWQLILGGRPGLKTLEHFLGLTINCWEKSSHHKFIWMLKTKIEQFKKKWNRIKRERVMQSFTPCALSKWWSSR
jgi:hypothetical protein